MKPKTVDEYINSFADNQKVMLSAIRAHITAILPDVNEQLKWNQPAMVEQDGMILLVYGGFKQHINLVVTPSTKQAFEDKLTGYKTNKGSIQFPYDEPLPLELIKDLVLYRANEYRGRKVNWR